MPSSVSVKFRKPIVRQMSLQNQITSQRTSAHILKKQLSEDVLDSRNFDAVEVTRQRWTSVERPESILRVNSAEAKVLQNVKFGTRPKPVKVAWADIKHNSTECSKDVEIVATKCAGQPRPLSIKTQRFKKPLLGHKDTLVYTRLQLAERLRNAWSEREKAKPNLNIFLAQPIDTIRSDNTESVHHQDNVSTLSDPSVPDKKRKAVQLREENEFLHSHCPLQEIIQPKLQTSLYEPKLQLNIFHKNEEIHEEVESLSNCEEKNSDEETKCLQELKKVEIKIIKNEELGDIDFSEKLLLGGKKENYTLSENCQVSHDENTEKKAQEHVIVSAQEKRANFRRSGILHKTLTETLTFSSQTILQYEEKNENADEVKKLTLKKAPLIRALSAPTQEQSFQKQKIVKPRLQRRLQPTSSFDNTSLPLENMTEMRERIKSAPVRRKLKSAAIRRKNKDKPNLSSDDEKETKELSRVTKKTSKRTYVSKGAEVITMVSLVSPAESDAEDSVITLPMESLPTQEEKVEISQSNVLKDLEQKDSSFDVQKFMSLRKTTKTVSFQTHSLLSKSYCASFPSRRAPAGTPVIVPPPINNNPALTPAQLQERDKRSLLYSGADVRGIKRRLLRTTSEPVKEDDESNENQKCFDAVQTLGVESENSKNSSDDKEGGDEEDDNEGVKLEQLEFKYPREKECWNLYQKMVAKGVSVSYDTVLRHADAHGISSAKKLFIADLLTKILENLTFMFFD